MTAGGREPRKELGMTIRTRGSLRFVGSVLGGVVLYWLLFHFVVTGTRRVHVPAYPLALPIVFGVIGLLEMVTGTPISQLDQAWQRLHVLLKIPVALVGGGLLLWAFLWIVARSLGA
jgi:hypothetical protein